MFQGLQQIYHCTEYHVNNLSSSFTNVNIRSWCVRFENNIRLVLVNYPACGHEWYKTSFVWSQKCSPLNSLTKHRCVNYAVISWYFCLIPLSNRLSIHPIQFHNICSMKDAAYTIKYTPCLLAIPLYNAYSSSFNLFNAFHLFMPHGNITGNNRQQLVAWYKDIYYKYDIWSNTYLASCKVSL